MASSASRNAEPLLSATVPTDVSPPTPPTAGPVTAEPAQADPHGGPRRLDRVFLHSLAWSASSRWLTQIVTWASTVVVARLLSPSDYGLIGMATLYMGFVAMLSEMGFGSAIVLLPKLSDEQIAQVNTVSVLVGFAAFLLSAAAAVPLSIYFHSPNLAPVVLVLSTTFVITSLRSVPYARLQRDLQFRQLALWDSGSALLGSVSMVGLAALGFGYWSLAASQIVSTLAVTALTVAYRPSRFARPRKQALREVLVFGHRMVVGRLAWYFYSNADFFVAGRMLGPAPLGSYTFAWTLSSMPGDKIATIIASLTPAFFSAVQKESTELRRYLITITEGLALAVLPATVGIGLVARELLPAAFGAQWRNAVAPAELLALFAGIRALRPVLNNATLALGDTRFQMWNGVVSAIVFPLAFWGGSRWGVVGIAGAWAAIYPLQFAVGVWRAVYLGAVTWRGYLGAIWPAISSTILMAAAVFAAKLLLERTGLPLGVRAAIEILVGALAYAATLLTVHRGRIARYVRMARDLRASKSAA